MIIGICGILIGILVLGTGLYYLKKEKDDPDSRKIYGVTSVLGAAVAVIGVVILLVQMV